MRLPHLNTALRVQKLAVKLHYGTQVVMLHNSSEYKVVAC